MDGKNLKTSMKLSILNPGMKKIILLVSVVVVLILVNIFVVIYGKTRKDGSDKTDLVTNSQISGNNSNTKDLAQNESDATKVLIAFLESLKKNDVNEILSYLSSDAQLPMFKGIINDGLAYKENYQYDIINAKLSSLENYAHIVTEISKGNQKEYYKFTLFKKNDTWKIILAEKI